MPLRVTSTRKPEPDWRRWFLRDYARYWYALGVLLFIVFGIGELARLSAPLSTGAAIGLLALALATLAAGIIGYILLWRRDTPGGQRVLRILRSIRGPISRGLRRALSRRAVVAANAPAPDNEGDHDEDESGDREGGRPIG